VSASKTLSRQWNAVRWLLLKRTPVHGLSRVGSIFELVPLTFALLKCPGIAVPASKEGQTWCSSGERLRTPFSTPFSHQHSKPVCVCYRTPSAFPIHATFSRYKVAEGQGAVQALRRCFAKAVGLFQIYLLRCSPSSLRFAWLQLFVSHDVAFAPPGGEPGGLRSRKRPNVDALAWHAEYSTSSSGIDNRSQLCDD
jgi:hypothetical protein